MCTYARFHCPQLARLVVHVKEAGTCAGYVLSTHLYNAALVAGWQAAVRAQVEVEPSSLKGVMQQLDDLRRCHKPQRDSETILASPLERVLPCRDATLWEPASCAVLETAQRGT